MPEAPDLPAQWSEALVKASPDAVLVVSSTGTIEMASPAAELLFGYRPEELVGRQIEVLVPDEVRSVHVRHRDGYVARPMSRPMGSNLALHGLRRDGTSFPVDVSLAPVVIGESTHTGAFVRDATERRRSEDLQRYVNEISQQLLAEAGIAKSLTLIAARARALVGAPIGWVVVPQRRGPLIVAAADGAGPGADALVGAELSPETSLSGEVIAKAVSTPVADMANDAIVLPEARRLGLGPGLYLPMHTPEGVVGVLVVARESGATGFATGEVRSLEVFASAAAIVVSLGRAREELEQLRRVSEHERIARDLHDTVIQRLFGLGMSLQALQLIADGATAERLSSAVDTIDQVIREIRETIFELYRPVDEALDVRQQVRHVVADAVGQLGYEPRVAFRGPVEATVTDDLVQHLLAVLREALSNVARHAGAASAEVEVTAKEGAVTLTVSDDGRGMPSTRGAGEGLANMETRAAALGGVVTIAAREPHGTIVEWTVPAPYD